MLLGESYSRAPQNRRSQLFPINMKKLHWRFQPAEWGFGSSLASSLLREQDVAVAHASAKFRLLIASSISCLFLKPIVAQSTPAFWKANFMAFTRSS